MHYSPINEPVWKWKLELGKTGWREHKPKVSRNCNGCSALRYLMANSKGLRLPLHQLRVPAKPGEIASSEHFPATRLGKAQLRSNLSSVLAQARWWIWTSTVSPNQQWFMYNALTVGAYEKECSKRIRSSAATMRSCVAAAPIQVHDGSSRRAN